MALRLEDVLEHPIARALNPLGKEFMSARWLSPGLNPGAQYGLSVAALLPFGHGFPHLKTVAVFQMMVDDFAVGRYAGKHTIVAPSSGNTAHAVARLAPAFGFREVKTILAVDVPESKKGILAALSSVELIEVSRGKSVAGRATEEGVRPGHYLLDQYGHSSNVLAHERFTGPEVVRACGGDIDVIAIAMGSGGTVTGVSHYLKRERSRGYVIGVRPKLGEQVPGTRDERRMKEVVNINFIPWKDAVDEVIEVGRKESFVRMRELWSEVEPQPGPSSAMAFAGLLQWIEHLDPKGREQLAGKKAAFICPDDGRFYSERTTGELDPDQGLKT